MMTKHYDVDSDGIEYVKISEDKILPDGTRMSFWTHRDGNAPTFDEVMEDVMYGCSDGIARRIARDVFAREDDARFVFDIANVIRERVRRR